MKDLLKWIVYGGLFLVPVLTLYVANDYFFPFITGKNFWFRIIVDVTLVAYVLLALYEPKYRPTWSWLLPAGGALLGVMFIANWFGAHPSSSFWSNFERMDGYVLLLHAYLYAFLLGIMMNSVQLWQRFFSLSLGVAALVAIGGLGQYLGSESITSLFNISQSPGRVDSTLGNAAYMAIYMLFHVFIAIWLAYQTRTNWLRYVYLGVIPFLIFMLLQTGTRGTAVGLAVAAVTTTAYIAAFGRNLGRPRQVAAYALGALLITVGSFIALRNTVVIQDQASLARVANISLEELEIRRIIWGIAWQGVQERPLLGYGQSNFNYVFNEYYDPRLYDQEQWFDRAHNIFLDWLIAGGVLGLLAYLSVFGALAYYLVVRPWKQSDEAAFSVTERGILIGLLVGYLTHNLVVFDNIVSYVFFAAIIGLVHARVSTPITTLKKAKVSEAAILQIGLPLSAAALLGAILFAHAPNMGAANDVIQAFRSVQNQAAIVSAGDGTGPLAMLEEFEQALDRNTFAEQEVTEQLAQQAISVLQSPQISQEVKDQFAAATERQLAQLVESKPNDARVHVFVASYYRAIGNDERAAAEMAIARALSPEKQSIILQQAFIELGRNDNQAALEFFEAAYLLAPEYLEARVYYAGALLTVGRVEDAIVLMETDSIKQAFARNDFVVAAAQSAGNNELLIELFEARAIPTNTNAQDWATLAFLYFQAGNASSAVTTLNEAGALIPSFASTATCFASNIENGEPNPQIGCQ
jgi:O-antigen ligase/cytochrome c-type biogenesis protein CcmH/NrfG